MTDKVLNKFSKHLRYSLHQASYLADNLKQSEIQPPHLLLGFWRTSGALAAEILSRAKADKTILEEFIKLLQPGATNAAEFSKHCQNLIVKAAAEAAAAKHPYVGTEHLLKVILDDPGPELSAFFKKAKWQIKQIQNELDLTFKNNSRLSELTDTFALDNIEEEPKKNSPVIPPTLLHFGTHLTDPERATKLDPVVGRDKEIQRLLHILGRRTKNNPVLLGDPGVGKTAIVEGLAKQIAEGNVPPILRHTKIVALDVGSILAGTMFRGEFENRIKQLVEELKANPQIVVFIDELHTIVGAGAAGGAVDAANLLKPALARGEIRCIGATTVEEYRQHIESDGALERRFQPIAVAEPSPSETLHILEGLRPYYETHHGVQITDEALAAAVSLGQRYLTERFFPDKAIDLIDEAAAKIKLQAPASKDLLTLQDLEIREQDLQRRKEEAASSEKYAVALKLKKELTTVISRRQSLEAKLQKRTNSRPVVTAQAVVEVLNNWTKIPLAELISEEKDKLTSLEERLRQSFFGHDQIVKNVVSTIQRAELGLSDRRRPLASFLLIGPSGVGKTTLARSLARAIFGQEDQLLFLDMSEFSEGLTVSKLIGAPAGYVGYKESGLLTEKVRRQPYQVICFDELDRAHADVSHLLLQILGEGSLRDATGRQINFRQTIVVATINPHRLNSPIGGFDAELAPTEFDSAKSLSQIYDIIPMELAARFDAILPMDKLNSADYAAIIEQTLGRINKQLAARQITIGLSPAALSKLIAEATQDHRGARAVEQRLRELIELPVAGRLLSSKTNRPGQLTLNFNKNGWHLSP